MKLNKFIKPKPDQDEKLCDQPTSVKLRTDQEAFVKEYRINVSKLTRAAIDDLMYQAKELDPDKKPVDAA